MSQSILNLTRPLILRQERYCKERNTPGGGKSGHGKETRTDDDQRA
jgi:hypothetical protein